MLRRRHFMGLLGAAAVVRAPAALAQQPALPIVGFLSQASPQPYANFVPAFVRGLAETGYAEGKNVALDYRWAEGREERLLALAADLVARRAVVIAALGGPPPAVAAKAATSVIPIVVLADDPVKTGLVASLNKPGGNVTGVGLFASMLYAKHLELLHEVLPGAVRIGIFVSPTHPTVTPDPGDTREAERKYGQKVQILHVTSEGALDAAFATLAEKRIEALVVSAGPDFTGRRGQIVGLAARYAVPAVFPWREYVVSGGLMSYGSSRTDAYRQAGVYTGRILR